MSPTTYMQDQARVLAPGLLASVRDAERQASVGGRDFRGFVYAHADGLVTLSRVEIPRPGESVAAYARYDGAPLGGHGRLAEGLLIGHVLLHRAAAADLACPCGLAIRPDLHAPDLSRGFAGIFCRCGAAGAAPMHDERMAGARVPNYFGEAVDAALARSRRKAAG